MNDTIIKDLLRIKDLVTVLYTSLRDKDEYISEKENKIRELEEKIRKLKAQIKVLENN